MMLCELTCTDCNSSFTSAGSLLQHFAEHVNNHSLSTSNQSGTVNDKLQIHMDNKPLMNDDQETTLESASIENLSPTNEEDNIDSGVEDLNPAQYCAVTLNNRGNVKKQYDCTMCNKSFGWSTDLKRHILIHTGERPFHCSLCNACFTRKFLLQKHLAKFHSKEYINDADNVQSSHTQESIRLKQKSRKQDKQCIKHNTNSDVPL